MLPSSSEDSTLFGDCLLSDVSVEKLSSAHVYLPPCLRFACLIALPTLVGVRAHSAWSHALVCSCTCTPTRVCVSLTGCAFCHVCSLSLPGPGVPIRTPRRLCACLPKTTASPGPPGGRGQPNVTWTLYREEDRKRRVEKDGDGGLNETKVKE